MNNYTIKEKSISMDDSWDVIVIGGGPAGCAAAAAAARGGVKALLIEATGCLGGMGTSGLVPAWCPFSDGEKIIYCGLAEKVFNESKRTMQHVKKETLDWIPIDPEHLKQVYDDLMTEYGVTVLFNTQLSLVETDDIGTVETIMVTNKGGLTALKAKIYVDCTGDADLSAWAGAEFHKGDPETGELQPATHCFVLSNVDTYAYVNGPFLHGANKEAPIYDIVRSGKYPLIPDVHMCNNLVGPSAVGFNAGHIWDVDNNDPYSVSKALMEGRKMAAAYKDALAEYYPSAFGNAFLATTGTLMGTRENRRIVGDYLLTLEDYMARRSFEDEICRNSYFVDIHHSRDQVDKIINSEWSELQHYEQYKKGESHGIPYRCLTPKGLKNVFVAGRSISCDRIVQGSIRVMPVCLSTGEAAGLAAALASAMEIPDVHEVDTSKLRSILRQEGAYLPE